MSGRVFIDAVALRRVRRSADFWNSEWQAEDVVDLLLKHMHDLESSIALADPEVEGDESDDGDGGCLDSDVHHQLVISHSL